jgi:NADPH-dependent glutamate synthase beta subunit-like oxidoreductase
MKRKFVLALGGVSLLIAAAFAGMSIAGSSDDHGAREVTELKTMTAVAKAPNAPARATARPKKAKKPTVQTFYAPSAVVPDDGAGTVVGLRCPKGKGEPISGGAATGEGIVISYLSRVGLNGKTKARTYFIGVDDNSDVVEQDGAGAFLEVQCAKNISVKF